MRKNPGLFSFFLGLLIIPALCQAFTTILSNESPNHTIASGNNEKVYGTSAPNQIILESGARAKLFNFPGQNSIQVQSGSDLFSVSRSGSYVTFQGADDTLLKIPATSDVQTIAFTDKTLTLNIYGNKVMLDDQVIDNTPATISSDRSTLAFTYSNYFPPTHIQSQLAEQWIKEVENRTNGEISINYFPASTLIKAAQTYEGVVQGIADIGMTVLAYSWGRFPVAAAIDLPMGYSSGVQATNIANGVLEKFDPEEFNDTELMFLHAHGPGLLHTRYKAVHTLDDLKGMKIRSIGSSSSFFPALGASPVGKSIEEAYFMLQKGVVDGSMHPMESNKSWKLAEVVSYMTQNFSTAYTTTFAVFMNKSKWNSLTADQQNTIREINVEFALKHGQAWDESDEEGLAVFKSKGGEVIAQSDAEAKKWEAQAENVVDEYIKTVAEKGIDGKAVVDYIKARL